jgi:hypothetical protein
MAIADHDRGRHRMTGPALRTAWLERRQHTGARDLTNGDAGDNAGWRSPGVDAVVGAIVELDHGPELDRGLARGTASTVPAVERALRMLAWERAAETGAAGPDSATLDALLADIVALWGVLASAELEPMPLPAARSIAIDGWVDAVAADRGVPCMDPLSGLHTAGYLAGRIHELDRIGGVDSQPSLVLLAVRWQEPAGPWLRIAIILQVAGALRSAVRAEATLCQDGAHTAYALVPDDGRARSERSDLQRMLDAEPLSAAAPAIELVPVPDHREYLPELLRTLRAKPHRGPAKPASATVSSSRARTGE